MSLFDPFSNNQYFGLEHALGTPLNPHSLSDGDPQPVLINGDINGPLLLGQGFILCEQCGSSIKGTYLNQHRRSGACERNAKRRNRDSN